MAEQPVSDYDLDRLGGRYSGLCEALRIAGEHLRSAADAAARDAIMGLFRAIEARADEVGIEHKAELGRRFDARGEPNPFA